MSLFRPGKVGITPAARQLCHDYHIDHMSLFWRHLHGNWGDVSDTDKASNVEAVKSGARIWSAYQFDAGRITIITTAADDDGDRDNTMIMMAEEY